MTHFHLDQCHDDITVSKIEVIFSLTITVEAFSLELISWEFAIKVLSFRYMGSELFKTQPMLSIVLTIWYWQAQVVASCLFAVYTHGEIRVCKHYVLWYMEICFRLGDFWYVSDNLCHHDGHRCPGAKLAPGYLQPSCCHIMEHNINSLWLSDAIWQHRSGSTVAQVMACCLTAPSHYLNQFSLTISKVLWHSYHKNNWRY